MTEKEFIIWLKGFVEGVHHYNLTPKQWDYLKEKLSKINSNTNYVQYKYTNIDWVTTNT